MISAKNIEESVTQLAGMLHAIENKLSFMPFADLMGFQMVSAKHGEVEIHLPAGRQHHNPMGTVNGGAICALADAAMGMTMVSVLKSEESFTTLEQKTNFLKPVWQGTLRSVGKLLKDGNTIALVEAKIYDEKDSLVAFSVSTCMKLRGDKTKDRQVKVATTH